jgi:hypothetical protein
MTGGYDSLVNLPSRIRKIKEKAGRGREGRQTRCENRESIADAIERDSPVAHGANLLGHSRRNRPRR